MSDLGGPLVLILLLCVFFIILGIVVYMGIPAVRRWLERKRQE